jgi:hypothetical protein
MKRAVIASFVLWVLSGCGATSRLKPPSHVSSARPLNVQGYPGERFAIGSFRVGWIERDGEAVSTPNARRGQTEKQETYRFDLHGKGRSLRGECTHAAQKSLAGSVMPSTRLSCTCREAAAVRLSLELANGRGNAKLAGASYVVSALHESEQGRRVASALGYAFRGPAGTGVVDVSQSGRAWLPASPSEDEQLGLICGYASVMLAQPLRFD